MDLFKYYMRDLGRYKIHHVILLSYMFVTSLTPKVVAILKTKMTNL